MIGRVALSVAFFLVILISISAYIGTIDLRSLQFHPYPQIASCHSPLRVFMYDLPPRFHVGMLGYAEQDDAPLTHQNLPRWRWTSGLKKQHSVEYWMMAYLLYAAAGGGTEGWRRLGFRIRGVLMCFSCPFFLH
uniref:Uncharacterized protein n=1 Tax=Kalanchoe fedtschenkoi TaxID=63787 RepID=A0A7N0VH28_KALFE